MIEVRKYYPGASIDTITCLSYLDKSRIIEDNQLTLDEILAEICEIFRVNIVDAKRQCRLRTLVRARKIFCYVAYKLTPSTLREIGEALGGQNHTTVLYNKEDVAGKLKVKDPDFLKYWNRYLCLTKLFIQTKVGMI